METKPDIKLYTLSEIAESVAKTGTFDFGDYDYVATINNPDCGERSCTFDFGTQELVIAHLMYDAKPESYYFLSVYMDQCFVLSKETKKFLERVLTQVNWENLTFVKIKKVSTREKKR